MTGRTNSSNNTINPWLVGMLAAAALAVIAAAPAHAGLATIPADNNSTIESTMEWPAQAISFEVEASRSTDTQMIVRHDPTIEIGPKAAEAPIPPAFVTGSVMLGGGAIARVLRKKKSI